MLANLPMPPCKCAYRSPTLSAAKKTAPTETTTTTTDTGFIPATSYQSVSSPVVVSGDSTTATGYALDPYTAFVNPYATTGQGIDAAELIGEEGPQSALPTSNAPIAAKTGSSLLALALLGAAFIFGG